jgi:tetratricopeptide (TPR) repeat protein
LRRRDPLISWGLLAGLSALAPVLALPFQTDVALFQPHRGYPASVGFAVAAVGLASLCGNRVIRQTASERARRVWRRAGVGVAAALLAAVVSVDAGLARSWRDEVTFWAVAVARYPGEAAYHQSLAAARLRAGDAPGAIDALSQALALDPELPRAAFNLGVAYTRLGRHDEAIAEFERAVVRDAADVKAWSNLGRLLELRGDATRALAAYRTALEIAPHLTAVRNRIAALETLRSTDRATTGRP